jgi:hypothetical protein
MPEIDKILVPNADIPVISNLGTIIYATNACLYRQ